MIRGNKLAILMAGIIFLSSTQSGFALNKDNVINDTSKNNNINLSEITLVDGKYTVENDALYANKDKESIARKYLNKISNIEVENGKIEVIFSFLEKDVIQNIKFKVNDKELSVEKVREEGKTIDYKIILNSLEDIVMVNADIKVPIVPNAMNVDFRIALKIDTLISEDTDVKPENPSIKPEEDNNQGDNIPENKPEIDNPNDNIQKPENNNQENEDSNLNNSNVSGYKNGTYKLNNKVITDSKIGYQAARQSLSATNYMEVKDGKVYITLGFNQTNLMENIRVLVNGKNIKYSVVSKNTSKKTMDIKFEVLNLKANVSIKAYILAIEQDISFGVEFVESSVIAISQNAASKPLATEVTSGGISETISNLSTDDDNESQYYKEAKSLGNELRGEYVKRYSIQNEVIHDSSIGKKMARKYLYETSYIDEDANGQKYLTITFSGTKVMDKFKILVNDEEVEYEVNNHEDDIKSFRFKINDLNDKIRFFMFVKPVKMNIDFEIKLLENTMQLLDKKEVVNSQNALANTSDEKVNISKIALLSSLMTTVMLSSIFLVGFKIYKKKSKNMNI
ncbi:MAG: NEAT domain-containing protein [Romboutsia sp.]